MSYQCKWFIFFVSSTKHLTFAQVSSNMSPIATEESLLLLTWPFVAVDKLPWQQKELSRCIATIYVCFPCSAKYISQLVLYGRNSQGYSHCNNFIKTIPFYVWKSWSLSSYVISSSSFEDYCAHEISILEEIFLHKIAAEWQYNVFVLWILILQSPSKSADTKYDEMHTILCTMPRTERIIYVPEDRRSFNKMYLFLQHFLVKNVMKICFNLSI